MKDQPKLLFAELLKELPHVDTTFRQLAILEAIQQGINGTRNLAQAVGCSAPVITRAMVTLTNQKLVRQRVDQQDLRLRVYMLTSEGSRVLIKLQWLIREHAR